MHEIHPIGKFLADYPLFTPFKAVEGYIRTFQDYTGPFEFTGIAFQFHCEEENEQKTFELEVPNSCKEHFGNMRGDIIPNELFKEEGMLDYNHHFIGTCRSCKKYQVDFLLHIYSDKKIPHNHDNVGRPATKTGEFVHADSLEENRANIFIEKLGAPPIKIKLNKSLEKYLDRESCNWYFKVKKSLQDNLGIGAFAYLRRIIEKELIRMVDDISHFDGADDKMSAIIAKHKGSNKPHLIYEDIFIYLPKSLQALGDNPFKILYTQTSEALHNLSEEDCLNRAKNIEMVFEFVIRKIYEEKSEILNIKNAIKSLKSNT